MVYIGCTLSSLKKHFDTDFKKLSLSGLIMSPFSRIYFYLQLNNKYSITIIDYDSSVDLKFVQVVQMLYIFTKNKLFCEFLESQHLESLEYRKSMPFIMHSFNMTDMIESNVSHHQISISLKILES